MHPDRINHYKFIERLGSGASGTAYRAMDTHTQQHVAIKLLSGDAAIQENMQRRFVREMTAMSKLNHANLVRFLDCGIYEGQYYCVMELVDFGTIKQALQLRRTFSWKETARCAIQICAALQHAHGLGIIHRDLKPANLFLSADGLVKLGDFGLARDTNEVTMTADGQTVGTCLYMAPEQIAGEKNIITGQVDLYSLGCLLYEMLSGSVPFPGNSFVEVVKQHYHVPPPDVRDQVRDCPPEIANLIQQLLAKQPKDRPKNAAAVRARLMRILKQYPADRQSSLSGHTWLRVAVVAGCLLLAAVSLLALLVWSVR